MSFSLIEATDRHFCRPRVNLPRQTHYRPSEASVTWVDKRGYKRVAGTCMRAAFFRCSGVAPTGSTSAYTQWIFELGKAVEQILVEQYKQMGIWIANNIDFYWPEYNIKGEIDILINEPGTDIIVPLEIKSYYGYNANRDLVGNTRQTGAPKTSQMLQALVYLYHFQDRFPYIKMVYYARDSAGRAEFDLTLVKEGENKTRVAINGIIDQRFYVENIISRYKELDQYVQLGQVPANDYELQFSPEKIQERYAIGEIGKTVYEKWEKAYKKNKELPCIGDWQCRPQYCQYSKLCWNTEITNEDTDVL